MLRLKKPLNQKRKNCVYQINVKTTSSITVIKDEIDQQAETARRPGLLERSFFLYNYLNFRLLPELFFSRVLCKAFRFFSDFS